MPITIDQYISQRKTTRTPAAKKFTYPRVPDVPSRAEKAAKKRRRIRIQPDVYKALQSSYDVQALQSHTAQRQDPWAVRAAQEVLPRVDTALIGLNTMPDVVQQSLGRGLQTLVNRGPARLQTAILKAFGISNLGAGVAKWVNTGLSGGSATVPALNLGSAVLFKRSDPSLTRRPQTTATHNFQTPQFNNRFSLNNYGTSRAIQQGRPPQQSANAFRSFNY